MPLTLIGWIQPVVMSGRLKPLTASARSNGINLNAIAFGMVDDG